MNDKPLILDCTLRDGGYYTNWDFDKELVKDYCEVMESLPIDYVEIGYRSIALDGGYLGEYFYCPEYVMKELKLLMPSKKLAIILNEKDTELKDLDELLDPCKEYLNLIRIAVDPNNYLRALIIAKEIKNKGFEVAFNVMYMSNWSNNNNFYENLTQINDVVDYFYMVDSFGGVFPDEVESITKLLKSSITVPIAFHGHNNLEMALINTLTAIKNGCVMVDATITGMGRGAGNLKTELLLTYLASKKGIKIEFNNLSALVSDFEILQKKYEWGTNLPYMVSGSNSLPQKDVMEWVSKRAYSIESIITALHNKKQSVIDNLKLPKFKRNKNYKQAIIIGGGINAKSHSKAIKEFVNYLDNVCIIHASSKNAKSYNNVDVMQFFCLVGNEGYRMNKVFKGNLNKIQFECILPPYPRKMGTYVPNEVIDKTSELLEINFTDKFKDSHFALAIQTAIELGVEQIYLVGFDGYSENVSLKEIELAEENEFLMLKINEIKNISIEAITPTKYKVINHKSIYSFLK